MTIRTSYKVEEKCPKVPPKQHETKSIQAILIDSIIPSNTPVSPATKNNQVEMSVESPPTAPAISVDPSSDVAFEPVIFGNKQTEQPQTNEPKVKGNKMKFVMKQTSVAEQPSQHSTISSGKMSEEILQTGKPAEILEKQNQVSDKPNEQPKHKQQKPVIVQQRGTRRSKRLSQKNLDRIDDEPSISQQPKRQDSLPSESGQSIEVFPIKARHCSEVASTSQEITQIVPSCARPKIKRTEMQDKPQVEERQSSETTGSRPSDLDPILRYFIENQKLPNLPVSKLAQEASKSQSSLQNSVSEISSIHSAQSNRLNYKTFQAEPNLLTKEMAQELRDEG